MAMFLLCFLDLCFVFIRLMEESREEATVVKSDAERVERY